MSVDAGELSVRGGASAEELAALVAALGGAAPRASTASDPARGPGYARWRRTRLAALRAGTDIGTGLGAAARTRRGAASVPGSGFRP
jgi:hypothetical protein